MSVALLAQDSGRAFQLGNAVSFGSLRGNSLTLDSLVVNSITANSITVGDDALPDVYYYGQASARNILGSVVGSAYTATVNGSATFSLVNTDFLGQQDTTPGNTANFLGLQQSLSEAPNSAVILLPAPLHYTLTSGGDALNPFVSASIITAGTGIPNTGGATPASYFARVRVGLQCYSPAVALRQKTADGLVSGTILPQADGLWLALPMSRTDAIPIFAPASGQPTAQVCWYIIGTPPGTPPQPFGAVTNIVPSLETNVVPYAPLVAPFTASKFAVSFAGGLVGSAVQFPVTGQATGVPAAQYGTFTTLKTFPQPDGSLVYPPVVFPASGATASTALAAISYNPNVVDDVLAPPALPPTPTGAVPGYYSTSGIWIQQIWWVANGEGVGSGGLNPGTYNVTHFFTNAGNSDNTGVAVASQVPLNAARLEVTARAPSAPGQDTRDGAFNVNIYLPRVVNTTTTSGIPASLPAYSYPVVFPGQPPPIISGTSFNAIASYGYWIVFLGTIGSSGADATAMRSSDGVAPPGGQAGVSQASGNVNTTLLGQFSRYPGTWAVATNPNANFSWQTTGNASGNAFIWKSGPVSSLGGATAGAWYTNAPNISGQLVLVPPP